MQKNYGPHGVKDRNVNQFGGFIRITQSKSTDYDID